MAWNQIGVGVGKRRGGGKIKIREEYTKHKRMERKTGILVSASLQTQKVNTNVQRLARIEEHKVQYPTTGQSIETTRSNPYPWNKKGKCDGFQIWAKTARTKVTGLRVICAEKKIQKYKNTKIYICMQTTLTSDMMAFLYIPSQVFVVF